MADIGETRGPLRYIVLGLLVTVSRSAIILPGFTVETGIFIEPLPSVTLYENSIPLFFQLPRMPRLHLNVATNESDCQTDRFRTCNMLNAVRSLQNNLSQVLEHYQSSLRYEPAEIVRNRMNLTKKARQEDEDLLIDFSKLSQKSKRNIISRFLNSCCDVAEDSTTRVIEARQKHIVEYIEKQKKSLNDKDANLIRFAQKMNIFSSEVNSSMEELRETMRGYKRSYDYLRDKIDWDERDLL